MSTKPPDFYFIENRHEKLEQFIGREDDVWILSYPKNGTHWVNEIATMLLNGKVEPSKDKEIFMVEFNSNATLDELPSPRVLNTHFPPRHLPAHILDKKIIFVTRNPKDTAVSFFHHTNILRKNPPKPPPGKGKPPKLMSENWNEFLEEFINLEDEKGRPESYFNYMLEWSDLLSKKDPPKNILHLSYEGIKVDHLAAVKKIAQFFGKEYEEEFYKSVVEQTSFSAMKQNHKCTNSPLGTQMFRKGKVGDWKNWFTVAQNEKFEKVYKQKMENCYLYQHTNTWS